MINLERARFIKLYLVTSVGAEIIRVSDTHGDRLISWNAADGSVLPENAWEQLEKEYVQKKAWLYREMGLPSVPKALPLPQEEAPSDMRPSLEERVAALELWQRHVIQEGAIEETAGDPSDKPGMSHPVGISLSDDGAEGMADRIVRFIHMARAMKGPEEKRTEGGGTGLGGVGAQAAAQCGSFGAPIPAPSLPPFSPFDLTHPQKVETLAALLQNVFANVDPGLLRGIVIEIKGSNEIFR